MSTISFKGNAVHTNGEIPAVGSKAPDFDLTSKDLTDVRLADYRGKRIVLNVFPSLDTPVCAMSVRRFNKEAANIPDTVVICVSEDLPFALSRFCAAEGIENVIAASAFRSKLFNTNYGLQMIDGPLAGLLARAVIIIDTDGKIIYTDLVEEITHEPDYESAIAVLK